MENNRRTTLSHECPCGNQTWEYLEDDETGRHAWYCVRCGRPERPRPQAPIPAWESDYAAGTDLDL
jgi:hypothetical protein